MFFYRHSVDWNVNLDMEAINIRLFIPDVLWVAFSIPPGSLSLVKCSVCIILGLKYC
jgi:hypothetical protein